MNTFRQGIKDGIPIALGYLAVSFSLGIAMRNAGMTALQGFLFSLVNLASAGEYAGLQVIVENGTYLEIAAVTIVANARYLLMSTALSQRFDKQTSFIHRLFVGYGITDEIFGITIGKSTQVQPFYVYGALSIAVPFWSFGTALGIMAGNILPARIVTALSVSLYGMFLAVVIPAAKKDKAVMSAVVLSALISFLSQYIPIIKDLSDGTRTIVLTIAAASFIAIALPHKEEDEHA